MVESAPDASPLQGQNSHRLLIDTAAPKKPSSETSERLLGLSVLLKYVTTFLTHERRRQEHNLIQAQRAGPGFPIFLKLGEKKMILVQIYLFF